MTKPDRIAAGTAVILYFVAAAYLLPGSEYLHSLGGGALMFAAIILTSVFLKRGWLPGFSVLAVGFISFAVLVMPTLPAMGGRVSEAIPIGFIGVQAAILLWAVLQWPYTLRPRSHVSLVSALEYALLLAAGLSLIATLPILLILLTSAPSPKTILLVYPAYFVGFLAAAIVYWSLQRVTHLAVGRYLIGVLAGTCVYGAIAPVVFLFRNEPIEFPLALMIAAICGGFVGPAVALDSPDRGSIVIADDSGPIWGAKRGILFGVTFAVVLGVPMLIRGPAIYGGTTFLKIISVATTFGLVGGLCVGALRSFTTQYWSAVIVGSLGGVFAVAAVLTIAFGVDGSTILYSLVGGILIGARVGSMGWRKARPESPA